MKKRFLVMFLVVSIVLFPVTSVPKVFNLETPDSNLETADFDPSTCVVKSDWLYVGIDEKGYDAAGQPRKIHFSTGGGGLVRFENLGIAAISEDRKSVRFKAEATFTFEVTAHTFWGVRDIFPQMEEKMASKWFLKVNNWHWFNVIITRLCNWKDTSIYYMNYSYMDLGEPNIYEFYNPLYITVGIPQLRSALGEFIFPEDPNNVTYTTPKIIGDVLRVYVTNLTYGKAGDYTDEFKDIAGVEKAQVKIEPASTFSSSNQKVINILKEADIGWEAGEVQEGQTIDNFKADGDQRGSEWKNPDPVNNRFLTFPLDLVLKPQIFPYVQYNNITKAIIDIWPLEPIHVPYGPTTQGIPKRLVGVHVSNYFLHWYFAVDVEFWADQELVAELSDFDLDNPFFKSGNWTWDTSIVGDYEVYLLLLGAANELFGSLITLLLIVLVIVAVKRIPKVKLKLKRTKSQK